jgi:hypothetical protein
MSGENFLEVRKGNKNIVKIIVLDGGVCGVRHVLGFG